MFKKNLIILTFLFLSIYQGFEIAALGVVTFGYTVLLKKVLESIPQFSKIKEKIPGDKKIKDYIFNWLIADSMEFAVISIFYFFNNQ